MPLIVLLPLFGVGTALEHRAGLVSWPQAKARECRPDLPLRAIDDASRRTHSAGQRRSMPARLCERTASTSKGGDMIKRAPWSLAIALVAMTSAAVAQQYVY